VEIIIRPARFEDIPHLCNLLSDLFSLESDFEPDPEKQARGLELLIGDSTGDSLVLVAGSGRDIFGMCSVQTLISSAEDGLVGFLEDVVVRKDRRKKGIGTRLLSEAVTWCATKGMNRIQLLADQENKLALKFCLICLRNSLG
jgi:GNAT superfamily N-acetyltransferase